MTRITNQRRSVLYVLSQNPGINTLQLNEIARTARGGHAAMYGLVDRAVGAGLIEHCKSASGRGRGLRITAKGEAALG